MTCVCEEIGQWQDADKGGPEKGPEAYGKVAGTDVDEPKGE